jgi:N4-gp56 family major capsid protein
MSDTSFLSANALTQKRWSETAFKWLLANTIFRDFIGKPGDSKPIIVDQELTAGKGDTVTYKLGKPLTSAGGSDDTDIENAEEAATDLNMPITVHERSNGVKIDGIMSDKRTTFNILKDGFVRLNNWSTQEQEKDIIYALTGLGNQAGYVGEGATDIATVNEKAPSTNRILYGGQTTAGVTSWKANDSEIGNAGGTSPTDHLFGTKVIDKLKTMARLASPKFPPVRWRGKYYYILVAHPLQIDSLKEETGNAGWSAIQQSANVRGTANPLFEREGQGEDRMWNGLIGIWSDVLLFDSELMPTRVAGETLSGSGGTYVLNAAITSGTYRVARCVLLGANAGVLLWGQHWTRRTKQFDYNRKTGVAMDGIYGVSKTQFRDPGLNQSANDAQEDYAVYCADTVVQEP